MNSTLKDFIEGTYTSNDAYKEFIRISLLLSTASDTISDGDIERLLDAQSSIGYVVELLVNAEEIKKEFERLWDKVEGAYAEQVTNGKTKYKHLEKMRESVSVASERRLAYSSYKLYEEYKDAIDDIEKRLVAKSEPIDPFAIAPEELTKLGE